MTEPNQLTGRPGDLTSTLNPKSTSASTAMLSKSVPPLSAVGSSRVPSTGTGGLTRPPRLSPMALMVSGSGWMAFTTPVRSR